MRIFLNHDNIVHKLILRGERDGRIHDLVIIGGGPAGLSAAIYAQRALLDTVLLEQEAVGGQVIITSEIDNYPGVPHTDGFTLTDTMQRQAEELGAKVLIDHAEKVVRNEETGLFEVRTPPHTYIAKAATPRISTASTR